MATTLGRGCAHVESFKGCSENQTVFRYVYRRFVLATSPAHLSLKVSCLAFRRLPDARRRSPLRPPVSWPSTLAVQAHTRCSECGTHRRLLLCLHCVYIGCYEARHLQQHCKANQHSLGQATVGGAPLAPHSRLRTALDLSYGTVYCSLCQDCVYDEELERIVLRETASSACSGTWNVWDRSFADVTLLLRDESRPRKLLRISENSFIGLRGLINLGNT